MIEGGGVTFTDVTALKKAQAVLRESEALRRRAGVVRDAVDAIIVHDLEGRILAWNPGAVRTSRSRSRGADACRRAARAHPGRG